MRKLILAANTAFLIVVGFVLVPGRCNALYPIFDNSTQKFGYIDCHGKLVVSPQFNRAYDFSEGLGKIEIGTDVHPYVGYVDLQGRIAIGAEFGDTGAFSSFSEGTSAILTSKGWGFIDRKGRTLFVLDDASANVTPPLESFSNGLALVFVKQGVKYVDKTGHMMFGKYFSLGTSFKGGVAAVEQGEEYGVINLKGRYLVRPQHNEISLSEDGTIRIKRKLKWYYYSTSMKFLFSSTRELDFSEGLAFFEERDKFGVINKYGKVVVKPKYDTPLILAGFSEGLGVVALNGKQGAIDELGRVRIPLIYDSLAPMKNGLMKFLKGNNFGYIDQKGQTIWQSIGAK